MTLANAPFDSDVLVVGTGPMGATTALALATYGIRTLAISRENWLAHTPRAHITNLRAMEVLRSLGLEEEVKRQATPWELMGETKFTTSLAGREIARLSSYGTGDERSGDYRRSSPCTMVDIPQSELEPIILNGAAKRRASFEFNTLYRSSVQDEDGVTVTLEHRPSGRVYEHRTRYLVGADGARSQVAEDAGLPIEGVLARAGTVYAQFNGDLSKYVAHRPAIMTWIVNQDAAVGEIGLGLLRAVRPWDRWIAGWGFDISQGDPDLSFKTARTRIKAYIGDPDFEPEITSVSPWYVNEAYAPYYSNKRIFCGGDATHRHPPSNGLGSNTCIQDAFNLAWKLAYVINGDAAPSLLDSYTQERAPIGRQIVERANQSRREFAPLKEVLAADRLGGPAGLEKLTAPTKEGAASRAKLARALELRNYEFNAQGVEMNHRYESAAVLPDTDQPEVWPQDKELYAQASTRPGAKIPHAWLVDASGHRISTLDLVGDGCFTILTGLSGSAWVDAVAEIGHPRVRVRVIGEPDAQDLYQSWQKIREIDEDGALLVRPDGVVAWRSMHSAGQRAEQMLSAALTGILGVRLPSTASPMVSVP
ncbi:FAD-dependent monooxygenase [Arthrobacter globiformis]|uniref:FAD-dependent monooxygenase n=1 Tax=Arthrobacter globiformis TaxID=1665 RepID=UPI002795056D|nr:FAD-dependent monooxygenase [Arthrobacter globiformis]MDQ0618268.1 2,4-dichlorophenol 6-monooxygenase [Arthrobacter globiformis]